MRQNWSPPWPGGDLRAGLGRVIGKACKATGGEARLAEKPGLGMVIYKYGNDANIEGSAELLPRGCNIREARKREARFLTR